MTTLMDKGELNRLITLTNPTGPDGAALTRQLLALYTDFPELMLNWAEKLFMRGQSGEALTVLQTAVLNRHYDKKPYYILSSAAKICARQNMVDAAHAIYSLGIKEYPDNPYFPTEKAQLYLDQGKAKDAIALLKTSHDEGRAEIVTVNTLAKAYLQDGNPQDAALMLRALHERGQTNMIMMNLLATAYIRQGTPQEAIALLKPRYDEDGMDARLVGTLANAYIQAGTPQAAILLLKPLHVHDQGDIFTYNTLANAYIHDSNPSAAIAVLKPLYDQGRGDVFTASILGRAYIQAGTPAIAIALLKPLYEQGRLNSAGITTLANACASGTDRKTFTSIKDDIKPQSLRDYLDAKLFYLEGDSNKAIALTRPYIEGDIFDAPKNIVSLYLSCIGDQSPLLGFLKVAVTDERFEYLLANRDMWRKNPGRAELADLKMSSTQTMYELGAVPVSGTDRSKAGLTKREAPVAVRYDHS